MSRSVKKKSLLVGISLCCISILAVLIVTEATLAFFFPTYYRSPGPNSTYNLHAQEFRTPVKMNSLNLRDHEIYPKQAAVRRVLCIGDSFTYGVGVYLEQTYLKRVEQILKRRGQKEEWINGSAGSCAPEQYFLLADRGDWIKPDMVFVQCYIGNDFYDTVNDTEQPAEPHGVPHAQVQEKPRPKVLSNGFRAILAKSRVAALVWNELIRHRWADDWLFRLNLRYGDRGIFLKRYPELERKLVFREVKGLWQIHRYCVQKGISMVLIIIPTKVQVFKKSLFDQQKYDVEKPNRIIQVFCKRKGIGCIDLLEKYQKVSQRSLERFYYKRDLHWTPQGHWFAARVLVDWLEARVRT